MYSSAGV